MVIGPGKTRFTRFPGGVHCVLYALFDAGARLDYGLMRRQLDWVLQRGVDGIVILGLATEAGKLDSAEQRGLIQRVANWLPAECPLSVTISGGTVAGQRGLAEFALAHRADMLILQPPTQPGLTGTAFLDFFIGVARGLECAVALQNAPQFLGRGFDISDIGRLAGQLDNIRVVKSETNAVETAGLVARLQGRVSVLGGRGGLELTDSLRAGCGGFILAPDCIDLSCRVYERWLAGDESGAEKLYAAFSPAVGFMMQSLDHLVCYGKRVFGARSGIPVYDRGPGLTPTPFGEAAARRWAARLDAIAAGRGGDSEPVKPG
ncbi:MAG: dihydrodipicolinate synthase family protein [Gammaproteobacteria bacterium]|nr:dihydrodipicolinate synthase family protein [Gammaproteobacteria bacterium]MDD9871662.1 dihydrodipicolinate synthase family protein [Gammaproteobacteria bacterium]